MGYAGRLEDKLRAQAFRKQGWSYGEILRIIPASKDTISRWCRDIKLNKKQLLKLYKNQRSGGLKGSIIGAKNQQKKRLEDTAILLNQGMKDVGQLEKRERFIAGLALYAAEGTKKDGRCEFTNSNPLLIQFMSKWFREFCNIQDSRLRGAIWIHDGLEPNKAKEYWSSISEIPQSQFHKTYIAVDKRNSKKVRKNIHNFGVFSIRFVDTTIHRLLTGWIAGMLKTSWYN